MSLETWERRSHYLWFSGFANPCYSMDVRMDITKVIYFCKKRKTSSFATIAYIIGKVLNSVRAFRYRILNGKVMEIEYANVAYTVSVNDKCFVNSRTSILLSYNEFCKTVRKQIDEINSQKIIQQVFNDTNIVDDIYCSCIPWIDFISVTQPIPDNMPQNNCIPRICWGKYTENNGRIEATFNITVNHALVDGRDLAQAFNQIQEWMSSPKDFLE